MTRFIILLITATLMGCQGIGIDHETAKQGEELRHDINDAEESYVEVGDKLLINNRNSYDKIIDQQAEISILKEKDAMGKIDANRALELIRQSAADRAKLYAVLDANRVEFDKGKGHFVNARRMVSQIQSMLDSLVRAREAEAAAKASAIRAGRKAADMIIEGGKSAGGIR